MPLPSIVAVHRCPTHSFSKHSESVIRLLPGLGVEGDAHCGATVRHRYLARRNPAAPNRTQVHLLATEFLAELASSAIVSPPILPGDLGENITTRGINLLTLPLGTRLVLGFEAVIELTGLRSPCTQMNTLRSGLMKAAFQPGTRSPRAGVMAIVLTGGVLRPFDPIAIELPPAPHLPLLPI